MFDIDFLQQGKVKSHVVHLYAQGCFRAEVATLLRQTAAARGWIWQELDPKQASAASGWSLYGPAMTSVDLDALLAAPEAESALGAIAEQMAGSKEAHFYLYGQGGGKLLEWPCWDKVLNAATVLHEPELTSGTVPKLLAYLGPQLACPLDTIGNRPALEQALREWVSAGTVSLPGFLMQLEVILVSCVDADTSLFQPALFQDMVAADHARATTPWALLIARFLRNRSAPDRNALLHAIDRARTAGDASAHELMGTIWRATFDLAKANETTNPGAGVVPDGWNANRWDSLRAHRSLRLPVLLRWQTMLAHHEPLLLRGDQEAWNALLRDVQGRVEKS